MKYKILGNSGVSGNPRTLGNLKLLGETQMYANKKGGPKVSFLSYLSI